MIKTFTLVLDLLQIPFNSGYISLAERLIEKPDVKLISFFEKGFVFFAFQELLLGKIANEDFISIWDSFGKLYDYQTNTVFAKEALVYWLKNEVQNYKNSYIVLDKKDQIYIEKSIPWLDSVLDGIKSQIFYL